jgi:hypothetical protein
MEGVGWDIREEKRREGKERGRWGGKGSEDGAASMDEQAPNMTGWVG